MPRQLDRRRTALAAGALALAGCSAAPATPAGDVAAPESERGQLGLMTSLPLYWPQGTAMGDLATGRGSVPWQRQALETRYALVPLDTLSPVAALADGAPETDPLAGIDRLAVIQPRGLSPADNVALDRWVRGGGRLLLVLDPALTGEYEAPLGDPRRPVDNALIPPVVARWGLAVSFDEAEEPAVTTAALGGTDLPLAMPGHVAISDGDAARCKVVAGGAAARCRVDEGHVTLIADAALFEHRELAGEEGAGLMAVLAAAVD